MAGPGLLVSVRDVEEAETALAGGASLIDVKEPANGPLGRADSVSIGEIVHAVGGRVPVSAALGELRDCPLVGAVRDLPENLAFVKWGLSGLLRGRWARSFELARQFLNDPARVVAVAYADWVPAAAPRPADVIAHACEARPAAVLIDTYQKDGSTLLDWLSVDEVSGLVARCRAADLRIALAGSLNRESISRLAGTAPDWFAVRGAACAGGREGRVSETRVRALVEWINGS